MMPNTDSALVNTVYDFLSKNSSATHIFSFLISRADENRMVHGCSYLYLSDVFDLSLPTVARTIKMLKDVGFIIVHKSETSNVYEINKEIFDEFRK